MTRVFIFPGQGAQIVGMGKELAQQFPEAAATFRTADAILDRPISRLCFDGPLEELTQTENTQPALFTTCVAALQVLTGLNVRPVGSAGHSVGEYAALVAAGAVSFEDALPVVRLRGQLMAEAVAETPGAMAAIVGLSLDAVRNVCADASDEGMVEPSNVNAPSQIVISGESRAVTAAMELTTQRGGRAIQLNVSAPFHCRLMAPVRDQLEPAVLNLSISPPEIPLVANATGGLVDSPDSIREALLEQIATPVLWTDCMQSFLSHGFRSFAEVGPGRVLAGLMRQIDRTASVLPAGTPADVEKLVAEEG